MKKRIFSGFLSAVLVLSLLPWSAMAADEQEPLTEQPQAEERQEQDPGVPVTLPADPASFAVSVPAPAPISTTVSSAVTPASLTMAESRLPSVRKFWPNFFSKRKPHSRSRSLISTTRTSSP